MAVIIKYAKLISSTRVQNIKNKGIKFLRSTELKTHTLIKKSQRLCDFEQGQVGKCGLIAALATVSQRPEFLTEIYPVIDHTSEGITLQFNMYCEGKPKTVEIDDALPFNKENSLVYARSLYPR